MVRPAELLHSTGLLLLVLALGACSEAKDVATRRAPTPQAALDADAPGIVPSPAFGFHQLRLGSDVSAASFGGLTGADKGQLVIWEVNGKAVHTGPSLEPSYTSPGDRVAAVVKAADASGSWVELSRHETVVLDSAPRVQEVHLQQDPHDPYLLHAILRAEDPDGEPIELRYRWFVDGELQVGQAGDRIQLDAEAEGSRVEVEVVAIDGNLESGVHRSPAMQLAGSPISLEIGSAAQIRELEGERVEYLVPIEFTEGARLELIDAPSSVRYERGALIWRPGEDERQLHMRVRVKGPDGNTVERDIDLQF